MHYGVDIGGTKIEFAVFDANYDRVSSRRIDTLTDNYEDFLAFIQNLVIEADKKYGANNSVGVGLPGIVNRKAISYSINVPCLNGNNVQQDLCGALDRDVRCINDVLAFALSEGRGGAADGCDSLVGVILGTGAASRYCSNGKPQTDADGVAGEWGHLPIAATLIDRYKLPLIQCSCGAIACIENYIAGPGLARLYSDRLGEQVDVAEGVARMRSGDTSAEEVFSLWIDCVASAFAQIVLHVNPEVIVVGGGLSNINELYDRLPGTLQNYLFNGLSPPPIRRAMFGDDSGVRGAAIMGARQAT